MKNERTLLLWIIIGLLIVMLVGVMAVLAVQQSRSQLNKNVVEQAIKNQQAIPAPK